MKRFNYFVMSLISAAAFTFTACSSSDDLNGGGSGEAKVDGFYMTLTVQTPTSTGSRTVEQTKDLNATAEESKITSGTFYLVDADGNIAYTKNISPTEFASTKFDIKETGQTTLKVPVQDVTEGVQYKVYFLANYTDAKPWENELTATAQFAKPYADDNKFVMFNENDKEVNGNGYTVTFQANNKNINDAAQVSGTIKLERVTARIDQPKTEATDIVANIVSEGENATPEDEKQAMLDAEAKVSGVELTGYAISNVPNKSYIMQHWEDLTITNPILKIPTGIAYWQNKDAFGTETKYVDGGFVKLPTETTHQDYVFENYANAENATSMYFEYTVTLNADEIKTQTGFDADATDGTFYRYNGIIYNSFNAIYKDYKGDAVNTLMFGGKTAAEMVELLYDEAGKVKLTEDELDTFRKSYTIEIFKGGKTYYKQAIKDNYIGYDYAIQRNTVYQLNVKNIYNLGADVPNSKKDQKPLYYLKVEVSVNPWVLNTQDVDLK